MTQEKFEKLVGEGIEAIPEKFLKQLKNVDIVIEDEPTAYQLEKLNTRALVKRGRRDKVSSPTRKEQGSMILGLYEGVPQTKRCYYGQVLPDKITIFKNSIERVARSRELSEARQSVKVSVQNAHRLEEEIRKIVKNTVWHEIAHHFGMDERRTRDAEAKRKIQKNNPEG